MLSIPDVGSRLAYVKPYRRADIVSSRPTGNDENGNNVENAVFPCNVSFMICTSRNESLQVIDIEITYMLQAQ